MEIKVLGGSCNNCDILKAGREDIKVEKVTDFVEIAKLGVMKTPALVIDGNIIFSGRMAEKIELYNIINKHIDN